MTEIATIDWFGRWGTSVYSENTAIFYTDMSTFVTEDHMLDWHSC